MFFSTKVFVRKHEQEKEKNEGPGTYTDFDVDSMTLVLRFPMSPDDLRTQRLLTHLGSFVGTYKGNSEKVISFPFIYLLHTTYYKNESKEVLRWLYVVTLGP